MPCALILTNRYSSVRRNHPYRRAAAPQVGAEPPADFPLYRHRKIDVHAAVGRAGFQVRRIIAWQPQMNPAVGGDGIEPFAFPAIAVELDVQAPVGGLCLDVPVHGLEVNSAVEGFHPQSARDFRDRDPAVVGLELEIRSTGYMHLEAHRPPFLTMGL